MSQLETMRASAGLSQQNLSRLAGVSQSTISDIESGRTPNPRVDTMKLIAKALNVPLIKLLDEEEAS